jgi:hypothetical protein
LVNVLNAPTANGVEQENSSLVNAVDPPKLVKSATCVQPYGSLNFMLVTVNDDEPVLNTVNVCAAIC